MLAMLLGLLSTGASLVPPLGATPDEVCAKAAMSSGRQSVPVDGTSLAYVRCGSGAPTIVFEGGFGGNLGNWETMFPMVGRFAPVFAYSRPGFTGSPAPWAGDADGMRTSEEAAVLLHNALAAANVAPPYVLVGHSLGGLYIQKFAQLFPGDTAGLVLMDNRPATLMRECRSSDIVECQPDSVSADWSAVLKSTFLGITPSEDVAPQAEQLGDIPVLVITAGVAESGLSKPFFDAFRNAQIEFARRLCNGRQITINDATHSSLSRLQAPQVVAEIEHFWDRLRR